MGRRIVRVSADLLNMLFEQGNEIPPRAGERIRVTLGLPAGAKLEAARVDTLSNTLELGYSHPDWEESQAGQPIPLMDVRFGLFTDSPPGKAVWDGPNHDSTVADPVVIGG